MPKAAMVHIPFPNSNDPDGWARRHVGRELVKGISPSDVVKNAWMHRHNPIINAVTSRTISAPPFLPTGIDYEPAVADGASEQEVVDALIKAGRC
jgi:hypothetical protein